MCKTLKFSNFCLNMKLNLKIFAFICLLLGGICLTSCHHALVKSESTPIYYSDSKFVNLLPTQVMVGSIDEVQHMEGSFSKGASSADSQADTSSTSFNSDVWVRANDSILSVVLFGSFGTTLAELTYAHDSIHFSSSVMDVEKMKAEYVLADLQACFYPFDVLQKNFEKSGFVFVEKRFEASDGMASTSDNADFERLLTENGNVIFRIVRKGKEINFVNELRRYQYHITLGNP